MTTPRLLVFDLDGTLIDSRIDLCNSVNATLHHYGRPRLPEEIIAGYIGDGVHALVRRALAHGEDDLANPDSLEEAVAWFIQYYNVHKLDFTYVYPGVLESLKDIRGRHPGLPIAVLTNKPVIPSRAICGHFGIDRFCFQIYGGNSFASKKPAPEGLLALVAAAAVLPEHTVMIGDSHVDVQTARAAGTRVLGCSFGLSPQTLAAARPDSTVDHAADWPAALGL